MASPVRGYLAVTLAATLWGVAGAIAKYLFASREVPPLFLTQVRMGSSFLVLALTLALVAPHLLRLQRHHIRFFTLFGILGMAAVQYTYLLAISETNVATAIFLQYLAPILTALWAWLVERQRLGGVVLTCLGLALTGAFLLLFGGTAHLLVGPLGLTAGLGSAFAMAFYTIYGAKGVGNLSPWTVLLYGLGFGTVFWLLVDAVLWAAGRPLEGVELLAVPEMWGFFAYIATLATTVPFGLYLVGLQYIVPTHAAITGMLEPVVGGVAAYLFVGDALLPAQVAGGALIVIAVVLLQTARDAKAAPSAPEIGSRDAAAGRG